MKVERVRIGDMLRLDRTPIDITEGNEYRKIGIYSWGRGFIHYPAVPGTEMGSLRYFTFPTGSLVLSNIQAWEAAVAVAGEAEAGHVASNRFLPYVPVDDRRVSTGYLRHYFLSDEGLDALRRASPGTQVRNRTLGKSLFEDLRVPVPPLADQHRIDMHLDAVGTQSGSLLSTSRPAEDVRGALLAKLFDDRVPLRPAADLFEVARGASLRLDGAGRSVAIGQASIRWEGIDLVRGKRVADEWADVQGTNRRVRAEDLLVNSTGEGTLGRACVATASFEGCLLDSHVLRLRPASPLANGAIVAAYLRSTRGRVAINDVKGANTTKQTELGVRRMSGLLLPALDRNDAHRALDSIRTIDRLVDRYAELSKFQTRAAFAALPAARNGIFDALR